jgi:hypothetical protein
MLKYMKKPANKQTFSHKNGYFSINIFVWFTGNLATG